VAVGHARGGLTTAPRAVETLRAVETVVPGLGISLDAGSTTGITSVLVFGAATDYALLLIARYREELRQQADRFVAMRTALRRTAEPILASGGTVVAAVSTLLLSEQESNRALGVACATGVLLAMASTLFVRPAALLIGVGAVLAVRAPGRQSGPGRPGLGRLGQVVARRPVPVAVSTPSRAIPVSIRPQAITRPVPVVGNRSP
jgi:putative drug exporter of the RND superfamily